MVIDRESWEKIQNDLEIIKARVSSLDRIAVLENRQVIIGDLADVIRTSTYAAAALYLTREPLSRQQLADGLGTDVSNVNKWTNGLLQKGYLYSFKHDGLIYYQRDEKIDLIDYGSIEPFRSLIRKWEQERKKK